MRTDFQLTRLLTVALGCMPVAKSNVHPPPPEHLGAVQDCIFPNCDIVTICNTSAMTSSS